MATELGAALHRRHQEHVLSCDPAANAERALEATLEVDGCRVRLRGRADLVRHEGERLVVEELKSHWPEEAHAGGPTPRLRREWLRQVTTYAWLLHRETGRAVACRVVLLPIGAGAPHSVDVAFAREPVEAAIRAACAQHVARARERAARARLRRRAAQAVTWPRPDHRPGQDQVERAVEAALDAGEQLLVDAPTGLGKTLAALVPALRHALVHDRRLYFATASGTGRRAVQAALAEILPPAQRGHPPPGPAPATLLRARARMCANDVLVCHDAVCRFAAGHADATRDAALVAGCFGAHGVATPDRIFARSEGAGACPFALSLDAADASVVTVGDLNYAFDPDVRLWAPGEPELSRTVVIADEVHQLAPRVRQALSAELEVAALERAAEACSFGGAPVHREQERVLRGLAAALREQLVEVTGLDPEAAPPFELPVEIADDGLGDWMPQLDLVLLATLAYRRAVGSLGADDPFLHAHRSVRRFARTFSAGSGRHATLAFARPGDVPPAARRLGLRRVCVDASGPLGRLLGSLHAFVGLSGSLAPLELHESDLGLDAARRAHVRVGDPFPAHCRRLVIDPRVDTRFERRTRHLPRVADTLCAVAEATPGATLALLSSHAQVGALLPECLARAPRPLPVHRQPPHDDDNERRALIEALDSGRPGLFLAVAGGVLAESLDPAPGALRAVVVVGPCLPPPTAERRLLEAHYEQSAGCGFDWAFVAPGLRRVIQAAGRLVRRESDRGLLVLLGRRFLREPYRGALPESWLDGRSAEDCVGDPAQAARELFAR